MTFSKKAWWIGCTAIAVGLAGCGDSDATGGGGTVIDGGSSNEGGSSDGGAPVGGSSEGGSDVGGSGGAASGEAIALFRGILYTDDMAEAKTYHDGLAGQAQRPAMQAGDIGHEPLLGTTLLGSTQNEFIAFDRWSSDANMDAFYSNPDFGEALGGFFANPPPEFDTFLRTDWHGWGDLDAADASEPHYVIVVRGRLADDPDVIHPQHDAIASGGEAQANAAGDVAHIVHLGRQDDREALFIDVWTSDENIEAFYSNPDFQAAVGSLFESPPQLRVYASTDWLQWSP